MCGCGHEHDPTELHVTDDPCAHDGDGVACTHRCDDLRAGRAAADLPGCAAAGGDRTSPRRPRPSPVAALTRPPAQRGVGRSRP